MNVSNCNKRRIVISVCSIYLICIALGIRLYILSANENEAMRVLSGQYTRRNVVAQKSAFVYDTKMNLLSHKNNGGLIIVNPKGIINKNKGIGYISDNSEYSFEELLAKVNSGVPFTVKIDEIPDGDVPNGLYVYPLYTTADNGLCRHILGYQSPDGAGKDGIYKIFDGFMRNNSGELSYKYTSGATGGVIDGGSFLTEDNNYTNNSGIMLTINAELQKELDEICDNALDMGGAAISELSTGRIIGLSSRPLYDSADINACLDSDRGELINRVFSGYTPGSVFKGVICAAALEKDESLYDFTYECKGSCMVSGRVFNCHERNGHGLIDMKEAFGFSCNTYFINLLEQTGFDYTLTICKKMGLGDSTALDGFLVKGGSIPDMGENHSDRYRANFSIGQGDLLLSCIDALNIYSICSTGFKVEPSLVRGIVEDNGDGSEIECILFEEKERVRVLSHGTVMKMNEMLRFCVTDGTGGIAQGKSVNVSGKTATAQSGQRKKGKELLHLWFAGVFPSEQPKYVAVVLCDGNAEKPQNPKEIFSRIADSTVRICG